MGLQRNFVIVYGQRGAAIGRENHVQGCVAWKQDRNRGQFLGFSWLACPRR